MPTHQTEVQIKRLWHVSVPHFSLVRTKLGEASLPGVRGLGRPFFAIEVEPHLRQQLNAVIREYLVGVSIALRLGPATWKTSMGRAPDWREPRTHYK